MQQFRRRQRAPDRQRAESVAEVPVGAEVHVAFPQQELQGGVGLFLGEADVRQVVHGLKVPAQGLGGLGVRLFRQPGDDLIEFYDV